MSCYWYKDDELEDKKGPDFEPPAFCDVLVVEPSRQDRLFSTTYPEMVERAWILTRPPAGLYIHDPTVTARQAEVARVSIMGDSEAPVSLVKGTSYMCSSPRVRGSPNKGSPKKTPPVNGASRKGSSSSVAKKSPSKEENTAGASKKGSSSSVAKKSPSKEETASKTTSKTKGDDTEAKDKTN